MQRFTEGDQVRIDIPDESDPDFEQLHGERVEVVKVFEDDAGKATGDERDSVLYRVQFSNGDSIDLRWRDLRPFNGGSE